MALLRVILLLNRRDRGLSYAARSRAARAPDAIQTARRVVPAKQKIIVAVIFAVFAALLIVPGLDRRFGWSQVPAAIVVLANLLIIAAFGLFLVVSRENTFQPQRSPSTRDSA
jgi:protein-S-isoprenylcysteine O-methyltransferase Ste14